MANINVEDVLFKLSDREKISLLAGKIVAFFITMIALSKSRPSRH